MLAPGPGSHGLAKKHEFARFSRTSANLRQYRLLPKRRATRSWYRRCHLAIVLNTPSLSSNATLRRGIARMLMTSRHAPAAVRQLPRTPTETPRHPPMLPHGAAFEPTRASACVSSTSPRMRVRPVRAACVFPVHCIHSRPAFDEQLHTRVLRAPRRYVQRRAVLRHVEILVAFLVYCPGVHSDFNQMTHTLSMSPFSAQSARCLAAKDSPPFAYLPFPLRLTAPYSLPIVPSRDSESFFRERPPGQPLCGCTCS